MLVSGCAGGLYLKLAGNIGVEAIDVVGARPIDSGVGQNILVLGSQSRAGQVGATLGDRGDSEELSDTAMLVHLSGDMKHAVVTSIPRDLIVPRPACVSRKADHRMIPASPGDMFNRAMNLGGPSCAVATVEHMANLRIDHFIKVDFNGFRGIVDALGGVDVCVPAPGIHDWRSGLNLDPGRHTIRDQEALAFVRDRHGVGGGGDLDRIKMQQAFLHSLAQKVQSAGTLSNPVTLYKLANAATSSLTVDPGLGSIRRLVSLARQLRADHARHHVHHRADHRRPQQPQPGRPDAARVRPDLPGHVGRPADRRLGIPAWQGFVRRRPAGAVLASGRRRRGDLGPRAQRDPPARSGGRGRQGPAAYGFPGRGDRFDPARLADRTVGRRG